MKRPLILLLSFGFVFLLGFTPPHSSGPIKEKIGGVSLVSPVNKVNDAWTAPVKDMGAGWVCMLPYGYSREGNPALRFDTERQWWGEQMAGMTELIRHAHGNGLKVMVKPMVWISGGWPGGFDMKTEEGWKNWEANYTKYIMTTARIAEAEGAELFCVGTEFKISSKIREKFWRQLIKDVRSVYSGPVTYAANWDEYPHIRFWDALDYIGLDAYFPLVSAKTPSSKALKNAWKMPLKKIKLLNKIYNKPILFTEFGYRSVDNCGWNQWELEGTRFSSKVNLEAQKNAYQAFFDTFWEEEWFAGVFLWQWYAHHKRAGGDGNSDYTPQNKPAAQLIKTWFEK